MGPGSIFSGWMRAGRLGAAPPSSCGGALPGTRARRGVSRAPSDHYWQYAARSVTRMSTAALVSPIPACGRYPSVRSASMSAVVVSKYLQSMCRGLPCAARGNCSARLLATPASLCAAPPARSSALGNTHGEHPVKGYCAKGLGIADDPVAWSRHRPRTSAGFCRSLLRDDNSGNAVEGEKVQTFTLSR
jgi:hypothetical protein